MDTQALRWKLKCGIIGFAHAFAALYWVTPNGRVEEAFAALKWTVWGVFVGLVRAAHVAYALWTTLYSLG